MPPKRQFDVTADELLASIYRTTEAFRKAVAAEVADLATKGRPFYDTRSGQARLRESYRNEKNAAAGWIAYDLPRLAGRELTESERQRYRRRLREMESAGLIDIAGRTRPQAIRLTASGRESAQRLIDSQTPASKANTP